MFPTTFTAVRPAFAKKSTDTIRAMPSAGKLSCAAVASSTTNAPDGTAAIPFVIIVKNNINGIN